MSVAPSLDVASLEKLRNEFRGALILPGDSDYDRHDPDNVFRLNQNIRP